MAVCEDSRTLIGSQNVFRWTGVRPVSRLALIMSASVRNCGAVALTVSSGNCYERHFRLDAQIGGNGFDDGAEVARSGVAAAV